MGCLKFWHPSLCQASVLDFQSTQFKQENGNMRVPLVRNLEIDDESISTFLGRLPSDRSRFFIACGIHVTTLLASKKSHLPLKLEMADFVFADGYSIHLLSKAAGCRKSERIATTDLIIDIFDEMKQGRKRGLKVAFIGGRMGIALAAAVNHTLSYPDDEIFARHGFFDDWTQPLYDLREFQPDVVLVGLGMPLELDWILRHQDQLPEAIYVTCGGLLRILAGVEKRSPSMIQRLKLEWLYRWVRHPSQVGTRYLGGMAIVAKDISTILRKSRKL